jgi:Flp pilus assembly protein TadG
MAVRRLSGYLWKSRSGGAATVEFYIVSFFVFIPLVMAVMQMAMFFVAKNTVNLATFAAARAGAASGGDKSVMRSTFTKAIVPFYANTTAEISTSNYVETMLKGYARASVDTFNPIFFKLDILNPTAASFSDFGVAKPGGGGRIIPTTNLSLYNQVGGSSQQTRADALLLKVEARYCYPLIFPVIDKLITKTLIGIGASLEDIACYEANRIPIKSQAVIRMTEPPDSSKVL